MKPEDIIIINYTDADGNKQIYTYKYGQEYKGDNSFVKDVYTALNYIIDNDADTTGLMMQLQVSKNR